ncbi:MAG: hypothetical protein WBX15_08290 [Thermoanaerobaculia bacterium]
MTTTRSIEWTIAEELLASLPGAPVELAEETEDVLRFHVRRMRGWKLTTIVLCRKSLAALAEDPVREIKLDYLRRDLERAVGTRKVFSYPRYIRGEKALVREEESPASRRLREARRRASVLTVRAVAAL